jgi:hypothetical protein
MTMKKTENYRRGFDEGQDAVRRMPRWSPRNPYDWESNDPVELELHEGWEDGATSAGWNEIYNNGELKREYQRR